MPETPVVSVKSGHLFEKSLVEKYVKETGKCPVTQEALTLEDLLPLKVRPRPFCGGWIMLVIMHRSCDCCCPGQPAACWPLDVRTQAQIARPFPTLQTNKTVKPRTAASTSIPGMMAAFHDEWDALMLEHHSVRAQLHQTRQELSHALYQHDAACRVIAKLIKERDEARHALENAKAMVGAYAWAWQGLLRQGTEPR